MYACWNKTDLHRCSQHEKLAASSGEPRLYSEGHRLQESFIMSIKLSACFLSSKQQEYQGIFCHLAVRHALLCRQKRLMHSLMKQHKVSDAYYKQPTENGLSNEPKIV